MLRQCVETGNIPVTTTLQGLGAFDQNVEKYNLDMLGMHGAAYANWAMRDADVVVSIGARFDDRVTGNVKKFAAGARAAEREGRGGLIHFDIAPENINKAVPVTIGVEGDARKNLELLLPLLTARGPLANGSSSWRRGRKKRRTATTTTSGSFISSRRR